MRIGVSVDCAGLAERMGFCIPQRVDKHSCGQEYAGVTENRPHQHMTGYWCR